MVNRMGLYIIYLAYPTNFTINVVVFPSKMSLFLQLTRDCLDMHFELSLIQVIKVALGSYTESVNGNLSIPPWKTVERSTQSTIENRMRNI